MRGLQSPFLVNLLATAQDNHWYAYARHLAKGHSTLSARQFRVLFGLTFSMHHSSLGSLYMLLDFQQGGEFFGYLQARQTSVFALEKCSNAVPGPTLSSIETIVDGNALPRRVERSR